MEATDTQTEVNEATDVRSTGLAVVDPPESRRAPDTDPVPRPPESLEEAGLPEELVAGLVLKTLHIRGATLGLDLADEIGLPMALLDDGLEELQELRLVEVHHTRGPRRGEYVFRLTRAGQQRATEELELCRYVGPAPVPFAEYQRWVALQSRRRAAVSESALRAGLDGIVLPDEMLDTLGPAINAGRSLFLYGRPGDGKTLLAERLAALLGDRYYVPHSVLIDGSIMIVHDPALHGRKPGAPEPSESADVALETEGAGPGAGGGSPAEPVDAEVEVLLQEIVRAVPEHDRRFARATRPVVITGGELTLEQLDLRWDPVGRMYQAPPQLKAAGGVLLIDDLGRQRVPVRELLNRWVVPLEHGHDYLTLRSGRTIAASFDCFVIFSTNLEPRELADEAFLRRIHYKVEVPGPDRAEYRLIFQRCCAERGIAFHEAALDHFFDELYGPGSLEPRRCHPRDILDHLCDIAAYRGEEPCLSPLLLRQAYRSCLLPTATQPEATGATIHD